MVPEITPQYTEDIEQCVYLVLSLIDISLHVFIVSHWYCPLQDDQSEKGRQL